MEYKYEPIFGDQSLFRFGPQNAVSARYGKDVHGNDNYIFDSGEIKATTGQLRDTPVIAMRRIIKVPTWTKADQLAGKLPEVGAKVIRVDHEDEWCNVIGEVIATWRCAENNESSQTCLRLKDGTLFLVECYSELKPIETPEEKAQRERDEWIDNACSFICFYDIGRVDAIKSLEITYDKLKSGELSMPVKGGE